MSLRGFWVENSMLPGSIWSTGVANGSSEPGSESRPETRADLGRLPGNLAATWPQLGLPNQAKLAPQELLISRSNIEAENSWILYWKSMILVLILHASMLSFSHLLCAFLTYAKMWKIYKNTVFFNSFRTSAFLASASDHLEFSMQEASK